jgi:GNAT superfamily N-acetyltransferase
MELLPIIIYRFNSYVEPMHAVAYRTTGMNEIDLIRPLWEQLNEHHPMKASRFRTHYERMTFEERRSYFRILHEAGQMRLDRAANSRNGKYIGYCVSSVSADNTGEGESLFMDETYRSSGIGTAFVTRGLAWMDSLGIVRKRVSAGDGNEAAGEFYRKFGFYLRMTLLEQKTDPD